MGVTPIRGLLQYAWPGEVELPDVVIRDLEPFGAEVERFDAGLPIDDEVDRALEDAFDRRGLLVFRDIELTHPQQVRLARMLVRKEDLEDGGDGVEVDDNFYISNTRPNSAAPFGRLQFHSDSMWADATVEVVSLYGVDVGEPAVPTTFVSGTNAWTTLSDHLRTRIDGLQALHTAGAVRRGDLTNVLVTSVENPPSSVKPLALPHPRTGKTILYACEQMTKEIVGLPHRESEALLGEVFAHLYDPETQLSHRWRTRDFLVWDNLALQHGRPNVHEDGPVRTLRKVFWPIPRLPADQLPTYSLPTSDTARR